MPAGTPRWLAFLRARPEWLVGPAWAVWLLVDALPITFGRPFLVGFLQTAEFHGNAGQAFPVTYACAVLLFAWAIFVLRPIGTVRAVLVAAAFPFAFIQLYEVPYDLLGRVVWPVDYAWASLPILWVLNLTWLALGLSTAIYWRVSRRAAIAVLLTTGLFVLWWLIFWPPLGAIDPPLNPEGSGYIVSKVALAATLALVLWEGRSLQPRRWARPPDRRPASASAGAAG